MSLLPPVNYVPKTVGSESSSCLHMSRPGLPTFAVQFPLPCLVVGVSSRGNDCESSIHCEELTDTFGVFRYIESIEVLPKN